MPGYASLHPQYTYLFNSYYNAIGERHCRPKRGLISRPQRWIGFGGGLTWIGHAPDNGFAFDNEGPRHQQFVQPFQLASRPVTNGEVLEFMADDGYQRGVSIAS